MDEYLAEVADFDAKYPGEQIEEDFKDDIRELHPKYGDSGINTKETLIRLGVRTKRIYNFLLEKVKSFIATSDTVSYTHLDVYKRQRQTYRELFRRYALGIYKTFPLDFASSLTYKVTGASVRGDFTTVQAVVHVTLDDKLEPQDINLYFRLHKQNGKIKLVDITMEQSSLILAYRNRFYEMIAADDGDMEWFLEDLEDLAVSAEENNRLRLEKSPF